MRVTFQVRLIEVAAPNDRGEFITALLDLNPAVLRRRPPTVASDRIRVHV
jgi:hypothetical protein